MRFHVLTLFPELLESASAVSILKRAKDRGQIEINAVNIRDFSAEKHHSVDDYPYGGGAGMIIQAQPVYDAYRSVCNGRSLRTVYLTPQGKTLTQEMLHALSKEPELILLCGHYEGIDERVIEEIVTDEISIGDYVLTGGELPALVLIDGIARLLPGVLHNETSADTESFESGLLEYPQYSRPPVWNGRRVPEILLSGDHGRVEEWRFERAYEKTAARRPDILGEEAKKRYELMLEKRRKKAARKARRAEKAAAAQSEATEKKDLSSP